MTRLILFSGLFITGALILLYPQRNADLSLYCSPEFEVTTETSSFEKVEKAVEPEIIEDFELKTWNRSKSIGFLRETQKHFFFIKYRLRQMRRDFDGQDTWSAGSESLRKKR